MLPARGTARRRRACGRNVPRGDLPREPAGAASERELPGHEANAAYAALGTRSARRAAKRGARGSAGAMGPSVPCAACRGKRRWAEGPTHVRLERLAERMQLAQQREDPGPRR